MIQRLWAMTPARLRPVLGTLGRRILRPAARQVTSRWPHYSRLFLVSDSSFWTISWDMRELAAIARRIGVRVSGSRWLRTSRNQAVFFGSHLDLLGGKWPKGPHRLGTAYFHGCPGTGVDEFDVAYGNLCRHHDEIHRIQVTHGEMRDLVLESGISPDKVFLIPIGVNLSYFYPQTPGSRQRARARYGIPESAVVVGSFQKDGVGWGEGSQPKLVKGPDVLLKTVEVLKPRVPELFVLLSGPARGYVKAGLERLGVPYRHYFLRHYPEVGGLFQALDVYVVASRQEGGPKAVLESMASGVPLVTTRVGQAMDLVQHGQNGWIVDVEDIEGLAHWVAHAASDRDSAGAVVRCARQTAEQHAYAAQTPLWRRFMQGFVEW